MQKGVDISKWQGAVDFNKFNLDFCIIKAGGGCPDPGEQLSAYIDKQFNRSREELRNRGIIRGFYWYSYSKLNSPENEANAFCDTVGALQPGEFMALDLEGDLCADPVEWSRRFLVQVEARQGHKPLIYMSLSVTRAYNWEPVINNGNGLWLAHYDNKPEFVDDTPWPFTAIKQYTSTGNECGITPVDVDVFNGSREQLLKYGYQAPQQPPQPPAPNVDPKDQQIADLTQKLADMTTRAEKAEQQNTVTVQLDQKTIDDLKSNITEAQKAFDTFKASNQEALNKLNGEILTLKKENEDLTANQATPEIISNAIKTYVANNTEIIAKGWLLANYKNLDKATESKIVGNWLKVQFLTLFGLLKPFLQKWAKRTKK